MDDAYTRAVMTVAPGGLRPGVPDLDGDGSGRSLGSLLPSGLETLAAPHGGWSGRSLCPWPLAVFPTYGEIQQGPTKEAALLARSEGWDVVMWRLDMPSFALYYGDITPLRAPEPGEVVFTRVTRLEGLDIPTEVLFQRGGSSWPGP